MMIARSYCTVKMHGLYTDRESGPLAKEQGCIDTKQRSFKGRPKRKDRNKGTMMRLDIDKEQACLDMHNE